jgi:hypothetical protein
MEKLMGVLKDVREKLDEDVAPDKEVIVYARIKVDVVNLPELKEAILDVAVDMEAVLQYPSKPVPWE